MLILQGSHFITFEMKRLIKKFILFFLESVLCTSGRIMIRKLYIARPGKAQIGNFNSKSSAYSLGRFRAFCTIAVLRNGAGSNSAGALEPW